MTRQLYDGLKHNGVNLNDDHKNWTKQEKIATISTVMGVKKKEEDCDDCDESYVLTVDNVIKILAIQMRFRY